jgi:hypothetical protein
MWKLSEIWQEPEGGTVFPFVYVFHIHLVYMFICPLIFNSEGVLDFRISTYGLFTILHNTIIVDFPRCLVVTYSLLPIHSFGPFRAAPSDFQHRTLTVCPYTPTLLSYYVGSHGSKLYQSFKSVSS